MNLFTKLGNLHKLTLLIAAVICCFYFQSCEKDSTKLSKLKSPVVIIGIGKNGNCVSVKDANGKIEVYTDSGLQISLGSSRNVGDTIR
jgi:hypothetical protein